MIERWFKGLFIGFQLVPCKDYCSYLVLGYMTIALYHDVKFQGQQGTILLQNSQSWTTACGLVGDPQLLSRLGRRGGVEEEREVRKLCEGYERNLDGPLLTPF